MDEKEKNRKLAQLHMEVTLLNKLVAFLCCCIPEHKDAIDTFVERLDLPMPELEPELQRIIDDARGNLLGEIAKNRQFFEQGMRKR